MRRLPRVSFVFAILIAAWFSQPLSAAVAFAGLFQNGMVIQRDLPLRVWGTATAGQSLTVQLKANGSVIRTANALADSQGRWLAVFEPVSNTQATYSLVASVNDGSETVSVSSILAGEVWLCTGQSNANMSLLDHSGAGFVFLPSDSGIRHFDVTKSTASSPQETINGSWVTPSPSTSTSITALGFFFARSLRERYPDVPVGIIRASWGDTFIESWLSAESNASRPDFQRRAASLENDAAERRRPSRPYNAMIHPLRHVSARGIFWYQGENNTAFPVLYRDQLATLVESWRTLFGRPDLPFLVVQLTGIGRTSSSGSDAWPGLREAQAAIRRIPGTAVAITIDIGTETTEIHPTNKEEIGRRLALLARRDTYGEPIDAEGPLYAGYSIEGSALRVHFSTNDLPLISRDGEPLRGFEIAGADGAFHSATAVIDGTSVILTSAAVPQPLAARYAWSNIAHGNLSSATTPPLPAEPFRTPFVRPTASTPQGLPPGRWMADLLGVVHSGGKYSLPTRPEGVDYLNEGADRVAELGSRTLKLWFNSDPRSAYPNFDGRPEFDWPTVGTGGSITHLTGLASHAFYRSAFSRPDFSTYYLVATEIARVNWRDGLSPSEEQTVAIEFRNLALHLIDTYAGTGKTFVLQNWEGDNLLGLAQFDPSTWDGMAEGFIAYLKARQRGVNEARAARPGADVAVWHCIEINYNPAAANPGDLDVPEEWTVVNRIVRDGYTSQGLVADLYSWSSWSGKAPGQEMRLLVGMDYLRSRAPPVGPLAPDNVAIGEFGAYENSFMPAGQQVHSESSGITYTSVVSNLFDYAWRGGARHALFWALYANGLRNGYSFNPAAPVSLTQQSLVGTWLIRPPGPPSQPEATYTPAWFHFADQVHRRLLQDDLSSWLHIHARSAGWSSSAAPQSFAPGIRSRVYRTSSSTPEWLVYRTDAPLVDVNVVAFQYGSDIAAERFSAAISVDGITWSAPFSLREVAVTNPDPANTSWKRSLLKLPATPPEDTRFLRLEIFGESTNWAFQIGAVTLVTAPAAPDAPAAPPQHWGVLGQPLALSVTAPDAIGPLTYEWWRDGRLVTTTTAPQLTLTGDPGDAGPYQVIARSPAGTSPATGVSVRLVSSWTGDDDNDGIPNLLAYSRGGDRAPSGPPILLEPEDNVLALSWTYDPQVALRLVVEASDDLRAWAPLAMRESGDTWSGASAASILHTPLSQGLLRARLPLTDAGSGTRVYYRLRAELP